MKPKYARMPPPPKTEEDRLRLRILQLEAEVAYLKELKMISSFINTSFILGAIVFGLALLGLLFYRQKTCCVNKLLFSTAIKCLFNDHINVHFIIKNEGF